MTELLRNGSFEGPHTGVEYSTAPPEWTNAVGTADLNRGVPSMGTPGGATDGDDWIWIAGEMIEQTLSTPLTTGTEYTFTIDYDSGSRSTPADSELSLQDQDGNVLGTFNAVYSAGLDYQTATITFTAASDITGIRIGSTNGADVFTLDNASLTAVCFARDTMIDTNQGEVAVQDLAEGMMVRTRDNGMQPIRWIGSTKRAARGQLAPIKIAAGTLGNTRDLRVSPQHRMVLEGWRAELLFGEAEVLAPAKALINDKTITRDEGGEVEYFHILFDQHEIIFAEGSATESFHPGEMGWSALDAATRNEILELFPELETDFDSYGLAARMSVKGQEAAVLAEFLS